jgi:hypothetical protein
VKKGRGEGEREEEIEKDSGVEIVDEEAKHEGENLVGLEDKTGTYNRCSKI